MKNSIGLCHIALLFVFFLASCAPKSSSLKTPEPEELLTNPLYSDQIERIDQERREKKLETLEELIKKNQVSKTPNDTEPVVIEVPREEVYKDPYNEDGDELIEPIHDKPLVQEYYIESGKKDEEQEKKPALSEESIENQEPDSLESEDEAQEPAVSEKETDITKDNNEEDKESKKIEIHLQKDTDQTLNGKRPVPKPKDLSDKEIKIEIELEPQRPPPEENSVSTPTPKPQENQESSEDKNEGNSLSQKVPRPTPKPENPSALTSSERPVPRPKKYDVRGFTAGWDGRYTGDKYTHYTLEALEKYGDNLLAGNMDDKGYCNHYNSLNRDERMQFWLMLISMVSKFESGYETGVTFTEKSGGVSRGLMQLGFSSTKSSVRAYSCNIKKYTDLHNPQKNLECAVKIMNHWVKLDRVLRGFSWGRDEKGNRIRNWKGVARYWSVLRLEIWGTRKRNQLAEIKARTTALPFCK